MILVHFTFIALTALKITLAVLHLLLQHYINSYIITLQYYANLYIVILSPSVMFSPLVAGGRRTDIEGIINQVTLEQSVHQLPPGIANWVECHCPT